MRAGTPFAFLRFTVGVCRIFDEQEFRRRGLFSVQDLTALTQLWEQSALLQSTETTQT
jgi:hypothetical protein